jgi:GT2 family glycosyltransferase
MRWSRAGEQRLATLREDLVVDFMERRSVALADVVASPSRYMLEWMRADGWRLPETTTVAPNVLATPPASRARRPEDLASPRPVRELVFFGRLDRRKGLPFFCDVVDRLDARDFAVTFLGSRVHFDGRPSDEWIRARTARWRRPVQLHLDRSREEALAYLAAPGRLAVMPARADNVPCTVQECLQLGIPFLATDVGGTAELVAPADRPGVLCAPDVDTFSARLVEILADGQRPARLAVDPVENARAWVEWHRDLPDATHVPARAETAAMELVVSACIAHFDRPALLEQMIASLERQTYGAFEVIVADDGSRHPETGPHLERLAARLEARGWTLLREPHRGPAFARDAAARRARGGWLLFLDDDDVALPHAVETLVRCAVHAGVDALVPFWRSFAGLEPPSDDTPVRRWFLPLGPALAPSLVAPEVGGAMILVRKDVYFACGGFPTDRDADEDWELLLTLVHRGYDLDVVPEPLFWYRDQEESRSRADNRFERLRSRLRLFEDMLPRELRDLASLALAELEGAGDREGVRRLERVRQVIDRSERRKADGSK